MDDLDPSPHVPTMSLPASQPPPLAELRAWVARQTQWRIKDASPEYLSDLVLICTELVCNAYEHGAHPVKIRLKISTLRNTVRVEVDDSSSQFPALTRHSPAEARGRGMRLVDRLCAVWGKEQRPGGKTVWAETVPY
jgi:two-component sensor histidine kinase